MSGERLEESPQGRLEEHRVVVDRFEGDLAVVEVDGDRFLDLPRWLLPPGTREDDVVALTIRVSPDGSVTCTARVDAGATAAARAEAERLIERLRQKDPGGDIVL
ncbi:MAG: DUF3006 domain-containing protein [bacterium]|jgi:hypothetical protein|nr:MAG: DUF3006 domain-containing protein [bacterium]